MNSQNMFFKKTKWTTSSKVEDKKKFLVLWGLSNFWRNDDDDLETFFVFRLSIVRHSFVFMC